MLLNLICVLNLLSLISTELQPQHQRGAASGIAVASQSLFKAVAPAGAGAV